MPSFPHWSHFAKLLCNTTTRILTLIQPTNLTQTSPVLVTHFCLCACVLSLTNHFFHVIHPYSQDTTHLHYHKGPWYCPFITPHPLTQPLKTSVICPLFLKFCHFKNVIYKWNHTVCTLFGLAFVPHNSLEVYASGV